MKILCSSCKKTKCRYAKGLCEVCYQKAYRKAYRKTDKYKAYRKTDKFKAWHKAYRKAYDKKVREGYKKAKAAGLIE